MTAPAPETLNPVEWDAPLVNPDAIGLFPATVFPAAEMIPRWLASGVRIRPHNYDTENTGVWAAQWCDDPGTERKDGERPELPEPFEPVVVWAYDECDLTRPSQTEVEARARQNLRLREETNVEREFIARVLADAGTPSTAASLIAAVGKLEEALAATNTVGQIHASPRWAAVAADAGLLTRTPAGYTTPLGHAWVFGGGYPPVLGDTLVATSPSYGWQGPVEFHGVVQSEHNRFAAVAERATVIGVEKAIAAVTVTTP